MVKVAFASFLGLASAGGQLSITWEDCGTSSAHAHVDKVEPSAITIGEDATITSSGNTNKKITSGHFSMKLTASLGVTETWTGDLCAAKDFKMPLGLGTVSWKGMACPVAVGPNQYSVGVKMASTIPAALAKADLGFTSLDQDGEQSLCVNTHMKKESFSVETNVTGTRPDCSKAACSADCQCSYKSCSDEVDACLADEHCAAAQDCAFTCACNDNACLLSCAAKTPSLKALPLAKCINSKCSGKKLLAPRPDCSKATCPDTCQCSYKSCSDEVDACLADEHCAASQDCAFACACNDNACLLSCAAKTPSLKALPLAKCINSNCNGKKFFV